MKIVKYLIPIFLFFTSLNTYALEECKTEELTRLNELAKNVSFTYEYRTEDVKPIEGSEEVNTEVIYKITAHNLPSDLIVEVSGEDRRFTEKENVLDGFINGDSVKLNILAYTKNLCSGKTLVTKIINLPYFNIWSLREECKDNSDFKYCKEYQYFNITEEEFLNELQEYKDKPLIDDIVKNENVNNFLKQNGIYIGVLAFVVVIGSVIFIVVNKKSKKKDRDL